MLFFHFLMRRASRFTLYSLGQPMWPWIMLGLAVFISLAILGMTSFIFMQIKPISDAFKTLSQIDSMLFFNQSLQCDCDNPQFCPFIHCDINTCGNPNRWDGFTCINPCSNFYKGTCFESKCIADDNIGICAEESECPNIFAGGNYTIECKNNLCSYELEVTTPMNTTMRSEIELCWSFVSNIKPCVDLRVSVIENTTICSYGFISV